MTDADDAAHDVTAKLTPGDPTSSSRDATDPGSIPEPAGHEIPRQRVSADGPGRTTADTDTSSDTGTGTDTSADTGTDTSADTGTDTSADTDIEGATVISGDGAAAEAETGPEPDGEVAAGRRKRSVWKTAAVIVASLALICSGTAAAVVFGLMNRYEDKVGRQDILGDVPKPVAVPDAAGVPMNFLVLGSDSRADEAAPLDDPDGARSDTIMIVHINAAHTGAFIFSIPRDSYVNVPAGGSWKGGMNKINAAFAYGGAKLAAKTVYELTRIPLDGAMIVNFGGIHSMVGEVGTVHVCVPYQVRSIHTDRVWDAGCHDMGPDETEDFMRQRKSVPGGDFGRIRDQQLVVRALADKISNSGMLTNPIRLDRLIVTAASSVTVDQSMNLRELIIALKGIKAANIDFATTPYSGTMTTPAGSSVRLDLAKAKVMFEAVIADKTTEWLAANPRGGPET